MLGADGVAGRETLLRAIADALLSADGDLERDLRARAFAHAAAVAGRADVPAQPLPEPLAGFVDKVTRNAYKVVDADVDALRHAGFSDDAILEAVLATAVGAGVARLGIGLDAIAGRR